MPRFVAFNGKKAAEFFLGLKDTASLPYGLHERWMGTTKILVMPSTPGMASRSWSEQPWHELAALILAQSLSAVVSDCNRERLRIRSF